ncbi:MAG: SRPBCC family protein [Planctomycetota bacterium]|jgi:ligand-binding SRPBCC domain-containing protein
MTIEITRSGRDHVLRCSLRLTRPRDEVFAFFADAHNLERITPPRLRFEILTPDPIEMREGLLIDYRLRLRGIPMRWQSAITAWEPPYRFVDEQRRGPYRRWIHEHVFEDDGDGTIVRDEVRYGVPGGRLVHALLVAPDLRRIFAYRSEVTRAQLGRPGPSPDGPSSAVPSS